MNMDKNIQEIPMEDIIPNRFQPRLSFNEEGITELSESIKQHGIIQPLVVRRLGDKFEIIAGERRYKAATMAGLTKVPVIISDIDDNKSAEVALVENIQRRNLTAIEEAKSYKNLLDRGYLTQEQLANKMGVSQSSIANKLRLLNLDEEVQDALLNEKISERHARALLSLEDKEDQKKWLQRIISERLTVRQLDIELKKKDENGTEEDGGIPLVDINPNIDEIVNNAEDINVVREPHDIASMLLPEGVTKEEKIEEEPVAPTKMPNKFFNFLEDEQANMSVLEPEDIFNTFNQNPIPNLSNEISTEEELKEKQEMEPVFNIETPVIEPVIANEEQIVPNKQTTNMQEVELLEDLDIDNNVNNVLNANNNIFSPFAGTLEEKTIESIPNEINPAPIIEPSIISNEGIQENIENQKPEEIIPVAPIINETPELDTNTNTLEQKENLNENSAIEPILNPMENNKEPIITDNEIISNEQSLEEPIINNEEITPFKSIFFNTGDEEEIEPVQEEPVLNNTIEEVKPVIEEPLIDPLDSIVTLEPDYEAKQEELAGTDLKTAINVVRDTVSDLERRGFVVEIEEADLEELYHITIKINKNN